MRRAGVGAALALAACAMVHAPAVGTPLGGPVLADSTRDAVLWTRPDSLPRAHEAFVARLRAARDRTDSLAAWGTALGDTLLRPYALRRIAALHLALGDSLSADRFWATLVTERSIWRWEAVRARSALALARGDTVGADSSLEREDRRNWPTGERAEWLERRIALRLSLRDTVAAMTFAGQMVAGYPAASQAARSLRLLEMIHAARGDSLPVADDERAAESELLRGRREAALVRFNRVAAMAPTFRVHLRRAKVLGELRRFGEARSAATAALRASRSASDSLQALLMRAWNLREAGDERAALAAYATAVGRESPRDPVASRTRARFNEELGKWKAARADYARVFAAGGDRAADASLRAGLMSLAAGEPNEALRWFARGDFDAARFWHGVVLRRTHRASGDSLLRALASLPGYSFYRCAARDTLGMRGWSRALDPLTAAPEEPGVRLARALDDLGCPDDATVVIDRWAAYDERIEGVRNRRLAPYARLANEWLEAVGVAYRAGRLRQAIRLAERAVIAGSGETVDYDWKVWPWAYPPAHDSLFAAFPESASATGLERALLQAVAWKESHFDPQARSRSDAVGLLQLKRPAVLDVARWLREAPPSDSALADPTLNLRYGARYLLGLLTRFKGDLPLALAAYNAGPTVANRWTRLRSLGGDALACEEIDYPETQDYVKTILAVRQAYRELRPTVVP